MDSLRLWSRITIVQTQQGRVAGSSAGGPVTGSVRWATRCVRYALYGLSGPRRACCQYQAHGQLGMTGRARAMGRASSAVLASGRPDHLVHYRLTLSSEGSSRARIAAASPFPHHCLDDSPG